MPIQAARPNKYEKKKQIYVTVLYLAIFGSIRGHIILKVYGSFAKMNKNAKLKKYI